MAVLKRSFKARTEGLLKRRFPFWEHHAFCPFELFFFAKVTLADLLNFLFLIYLLEFLAPEGTASELFWSRRWPWRRKGRRDGMQSLRLAWPPMCLAIRKWQLIEFYIYLSALILKRMARLWRKGVVWEPTRFPDLRLPLLLSFFLFLQRAIYASHLQILG